jgi:hypothetical protein
MDLDLPGMTLHEATRGREGVVFKGTSLALHAAIERRRTGGDVIVCGPDLAKNRSVARQIEGAVGPCRPQPPHIQSAGPFALPHFQQDGGSPEGHTFYETLRRKGRRP